MPLDDAIGTRALVEIVLLALLAGPLSFWISAYRMTYSAESLSHGLLPGLVLAALTGAPLAAGAGAGAAVAAGGISRADPHDRIGTQTATGVVVTGMLGAGALIALASESPPRLETLLFGDPLSAGAADLVAAGAVAVAGLTTLVLLHRPLAAVILDPAGASAVGIRPRAVRLALLVLVAATVGVAVRGLGALLVLALLAAPATAVRRHVRSTAAAMAAGAVVAVVAATTGLVASYQLDSAAGASIALALCLAAAAGAVLPPFRRELGRPGR